MQCDCIKDNTNTKRDRIFLLAGTQLQQYSIEINLYSIKNFVIFKLHNSFELKFYHYLIIHVLIHMILM